MVDMNSVIIVNIQRFIRNQDRTIGEIADGTGLSIAEVSQLLNGTKAITAPELKKFADFFGATTQELVQIHGEICYLSSIEQLRLKITDGKYKEVLDIADRLSDMILFHKKIRENGEKMLQPLKPEL